MTLQERNRCVSGKRLLFNQAVCGFVFLQTRVRPAVSFCFLICCLARSHAAQLLAFMADTVSARFGRLGMRQKAEFNGENCDNQGCQKAKKLRAPQTAQPCQAPLSQAGEVLRTAAATFVGCPWDEAFNARGRAHGRAHKVRCIGSSCGFHLPST